jgi:hypothetical protein
MQADMKAFARMMMFSGLFERYQRDQARRPIRRSTPANPKYRLSNQNHGQGESTARRKMAARSNRINRQRCRHWKH